MMVKSCLFRKAFAINILLLIICAKVANAQNAELPHSYDYSKIASHPRILLNKGEEQLIKKSIVGNPEFLAVYSHIIGFSNGLLAEKPLEFKKEGKRLLAVSRKALTRLYYLSFSYRITKDVKYLNKVEEELNVVCDFESWNPSHFLDVGEMCMAVAIAYDWLYDDLKESTKQNVRKAILEKAFEPSYVKEYSWFLERHNNWNSVCNAGLLFGALAIFESEKEKSIAIIERTLISNKLPLKAYGPDGNYPEGPGYWNYGTSFQVMLFAALESALGSDKGLSKAPGFMNTANYMLYAVGTSGKYFNYYDGAASVAPSPSMFWFADKLKDPSLVYTEVKAIKNGLYTQTNKSDEERLIPNTLVFGKKLMLVEAKAPLNQFYSGNGLTPIVIVRSGWENGKGRYLGIKGGQASDAHGHMDQGTFVYDVGSLRWAADFGLQSYITLESKGVDLWNMTQNSQRWDIFRYNNLNHNTLTINNQRHNVDGFAKIVATFDNRKEAGALVDIKPALNLNDELKTAIRKAVIVDNDYLKIEDAIATNAKPVDLRWNMVTPAKAEIIDKNTIKLSQQGKTMLLKFTADIPFKLVIRPSENPKEYKNEFDNYNYGDYNQPNQGSVMIGFDVNIAANKTTKFVVTLTEAIPELALKENIIILDAPNPNTASKGDKLFHDISPIGIDNAGYLYPLGTPDWTTYGKTNIKNVLNKSFNFRIDAKRIEPTGIVNAGIDRSADGQLGVRGGDGNGIDRNEGYLLGLDLKDLPTNVMLELTKIAFNLLDGAESCTIVNRKDPSKMTVITADNIKKSQEVKITPTYFKKFVDVSSLGISLKGGEDHKEFLSLFNTSASGNFRIAGFEFVMR